MAPPPITIPVALSHVALLAPLDLTTIEQYVNAVYMLSANRRGYVGRRPGSLSSIPDVVQPSAAGELLRILILDVNTAFVLPAGVVALTTSTIPAVSNFMATAL